MQGQGPGTGTAIVVAIIGAVGLILAAIISKTDLMPTMPAQPVVEPGAPEFIQIVSPTEVPQPVERVPPTEVEEPTQPAVAIDPQIPCASLPVYAVGSVVTTTAEVNLRDGPTTDSAAVAVLLAGERLQITGDFQEAGQCDWWPVTVTETGQSGWVMAQFLSP
jgi:uncharacterized protein YgiM (DUF1202 family)